MGTEHEQSAVRVEDTEQPEKFPIKLLAFDLAAHVGWIIGGVVLAQISSMGGNESYLSVEKVVTSSISLPLMVLFLIAVPIVKFINYQKKIMNWRSDWQQALSTINVTKSLTTILPLIMAALLAITIALEVGFFSMAQEFVPFFIICVGSQMLFGEPFALLFVKHFERTCAFVPIDTTAPLKAAKVSIRLYTIGYL